MLPLLQRSCAALCLLAALSSPPAAQAFPPRLKWLSVSSGLYLDRWAGGGGGNGWSWREKDHYYNPPQTLASLTLAGGLALTPALGLNLGLPFFRNSIDTYTNFNGAATAAESRAGIGDLEVALPLRLGGGDRAVTVQPQFSLPGTLFGGYQPVYLEPWTGFGVYRGALGVFHSRGAHLFWGSAETVLFKPEGEEPGLVEAGDAMFKGGYSRKWKLPAQLVGKAGADFGLARYRWAGDVAQTSWSLDPKLSLARAAGRQEVSFTAGATLYSYQGKAGRYDTYGSRRVFLSLYYGFYR